MTRSKSNLRALMVNCGGEGRSLFCDHARLPGVLEQTPGIDNRANISERFELKNLASRRDRNGACIEVDRNHICGLQALAQTSLAFAGVKFSGCDAISEEDTRKAFG